MSFFFCIPLPQCRETVESKHLGDAEEPVGCSV